MKLNAINILVFYCTSKIISIIGSEQGIFWVIALQMIRMHKIKSAILIHVTEQLTFFFFTNIFQLNILFAQDVPSPRHDSTYFENYYAKLVGRLYFSKKYTSLKMEAINNEHSITYKPKTISKVQC